MAHPYEDRILRVLDYIHDNPAGDLSLDALADLAAMSRFHWHRVFRSVTGETLAQTVRRMRMHRAAVELASGASDIAALARKLGYADAPSFSRAFAETYGQPPGSFRARQDFRPFPPSFPKGVPLMFPVEIRTFPTRPLVAIPHRGPYPEIGRAFEKLSAVIATRNLFGQVVQMVAVYYDDPSATDPKDLRSHAAFEMSGSYAADAPLEALELTGGRHAVLHFKGPYAGLPAAYDQLYGTWLPSSGEMPSDHPSFEIYLNSPMDTAPEDLLTQICVRLKG
jgi:AraC family transcriptional regulator